MISHSVSLDYQLTPGWMAPFIQGLMRGQAIARQCTACTHISFPPLRVCNCGQTYAQWIPLSGCAKVIHRTQGIDGDFALVRFDGADNQAVVELCGFHQSQLSGELRTLAQAIPALILHPMDACETQ